MARTKAGVAPAKTPAPATRSAETSQALDTRVVYCGEIDRFFKEQHTGMIPLSVREILDEQIARKLV